MKSIHNSFKYFTESFWVLWGKGSLSTFLEALKYTAGNFKKGK